MKYRYDGEEGIVRVSLTLREAFDLRDAAIRCAPEPFLAPMDFEYEVDGRTIGAKARAAAQPHPMHALSRLLKDALCDAAGVAGADA